MKKLSLALVLALCAVVSAVAQNANGRITGVITDPQGAVIPAARVTVTNSATHLSRTTESGADGTYQVLDLPIGTYTVTAEHSGFTKVVLADQQLLINQTLRVDIPMSIGQTSETVMVEGSGVTVETINSTIGQSVTGRPVQELPLNGRNVLDLALTLPGVVETNPDSNAAGTYSVAGGRSDSVTFLLDGGMNNNLLDNGVVLNPNPDTIAEFKVLQNNYTAEYGRNSGGIISVVTKSGTNDLHGSLFDFVRNDAFNANSFFNNQQNLPVPVLKRQQYGATLGGPITIPKIVNGRDRLFFFVGFQGQRQTATGINPGVTVYTPAESNGDFSHAANGSPDPLVASFLQQHPFFQSNPNLAAQAIIDPARIDPVAQNYIKAGLIPTAPTGTLFPQAGSTDNRDELTGKVDYLISDKDRISATLGWNNNPPVEPLHHRCERAGLSRHHAVPSVLRESCVHADVFADSAQWKLHMTVQRSNTLQDQPAAKLPTASQLGVGITPDRASGPPLLAFNSGMTTGFSYGGPTTIINNTYVYSDTLTWIRGRHNWKFGGGLSAYQNNTVYDYLVNGYFLFSGTAGVDWLSERPGGFSLRPSGLLHAVRRSSVKHSQQEL